METKGRMTDLRQHRVGITKMKTSILLEVDIPAEKLERYRDAPLRIGIARWREKRTLTQNAYYWTLIGKAAAALRMSGPMLHNLILRQYGQLWLIGGKVVEVDIPDTDEAEAEALQSSTFHVRPTSYTYERDDDTRIRVYQLLRGSHTYNTEEMAALLNGLVQTCGDIGVETMTPAELDHLRQMAEEEEKRKWRTE